MRLTQFPDIQWLRKQAKENFQNGKGVNDQPLPQKGWPSVVLNTTSFGAERNGIKGPFSIFLNLSGKSIVKADGKHIELTDDNLCTINQGDYYDLIIPESYKTDTFNIHFGDQLYDDVVKNLSESTNQLLNNPFEKPSISYQTVTKSTWKSAPIHRHINTLIDFYQLDGQDETKEFELLGGLLNTMLQEQWSEAQKHQGIDALKPSTQKELSSRINLSIDYIHAHFKEKVSLDELASIACLSKYHYLRTFKSLYGCTPQQMIAQLRFQKATCLLKGSEQSLSEIAPYLGFSELAAFSRFFYKNAGCSPKAYRLNN